MRESAERFLTLTKHFFWRFFWNETIPFREHMEASIIVILAMLAVAGGYLSNSLLFYYLYSDVPLYDSSIWIKKCFFISFFMMIMGFISALELRVVFPDITEHSNISPLPISSKLFFLSKFSSLLLFVGLFSMSSNLFASFIFPLFITSLKKVSFFFLLRFFIAHILSVYLANLFIFLLGAFLLGISLVVFPFHLFEKLSTYLQSFLMVLFLISFSFFPTIFSSLEKNELNSSFIYLFPPMWFTGLYDTILGLDEPVFKKLALLSLLVTFVLGILFVLFSFITYRKLLLRLVEVKKAKKKGLIKKILDVSFGLLFRNPIERVVFDFVKKTLRSSLVHKVYLSGFLAVGLGISLFLVIPLLSRNYQSIFSINKTLVSIPLILGFFKILGTRIIVTIPSNLESNWIFKLTEKGNKKFYISGLKKSIFILQILPLFSILFLFYSFIWGVKIALLHILYGITITYLLMEVLFSNFKKIPFTCSFLPGKSDIKNYWPLYLFAFLSYVSIFTFLEYWMLKERNLFIYFYILLFLIRALLRITSKRSFDFDFLYEEEPEPVVTTLNLRE